jgi:hypothetical protein
MKERVSREHAGSGEAVDSCPSPRKVFPNLSKGERKRRGPRLVHLGKRTGAAEGKPTIDCSRVRKVKRTIRLHPNVKSRKKASFLKFAKSDHLLRNCPDASENKIKKLLDELKKVSAQTRRH